MKYEQPTNPMRFTVYTPGNWTTHYVFAVGVESSSLIFVTIDGIFYPSRQVGYAEVLLNGEWCRLESTRTSS